MPCAGNGSATMDAGRRLPVRGPRPRPTGGCHGPADSLFDFRRCLRHRLAGSGPPRGSRTSSRGEGSIPGPAASSRSLACERDGRHSGPDRQVEQAALRLEEHPRAGIPRQVAAHDRRADQGIAGERERQHGSETGRSEVHQGPGSSGTGRRSAPGRSGLPGSRAGRGRKGLRPPDVAERSVELCMRAEASRPVPGLEEGRPPGAGRRLTAGSGRRRRGGGVRGGGVRRATRPRRFPADRLRLSSARSRGARTWWRAPSRGSRARGPRPSRS